MSIYEDRFDAAELPRRITEVEQRLTDLNSQSAERAEEPSPGGRERLHALLGQASVITGSAEPTLVTAPQLDGVGNTLERLRDALANFESEVIGFPEVDAIADELVEQLRRWPQANGVPPDEIREAASRFRRSAGQLLAGLQSEINDVQSQVGGLREHTSELRTQSDEALANAIAQVEALTNTVSEQQGRLEEAIRSNQDQFSAAQERRVEQFGEQVSEFEGRIAKTESDTKEKLDATESRLVEDSRNVMSEMHEQLAEAQRIVGAIATTGTVGGFQIEAGSQRRTANLLRVAALTAGLGAATLAIWGVIHAQQSSGDTVDVLAKGLASFIFFGIAGYLATQSGRHRDREERARRRELELAAFGPFIGDLSEERQEALVEKLADRIFGHEPPATNGDDGLTKENVSLVGQIAAIIRGTP